LALMLDGDPYRPGATATKFGAFARAMDDVVDVVGVNDLRLSGYQRFVAAALTFRPDRRAWKEHYRKNPWTFIMRSARSRKWIRTLRTQPDIVLQVGAMSKPAVPRGTPYALYLDFTFELTRREWPARAPMSRIEQVIWKRQETHTYRRASVIFCRGSHVAHSLIRDYGVPPDRIHVVGAGANIALPDLADHVNPMEPRVLFIGSDFLRKGGDVLLDAWPLVLKHVPTARLVMLGPVHQPLPPNTETNHGDWNPQRILRELARSQVFVMPSRCETWGDVFIEAMCFGVPCIGTTMDAMPEIIEDGVTGFVVPPDCSSAVADRIVLLLTDMEKRKDFSIASRKRVEERFLWESVVSTMTRVMEDSLFRERTILAVSG
jgi:alpha-maltose-1-phosphate synthase